MANKENILFYFRVNKIFALLTLRCNPKTLYRRLMMMVMMMNFLLIKIASDLFTFGSDGR